MELQSNSTEIDNQPLESDLGDRSRFLKSLGFVRDRFDESPTVGDSSSDGLILTSNFEDDLELPGVKNLMEPAPRDEMAADESVSVEAEQAEFPALFTEESPFDLSGVDDAIWGVVDHRIRPEGFDWKRTEAEMVAAQDGEASPEAKKKVRTRFR